MLYLTFRYPGKVCTFGEVAPHETDTVFDGALLPTVAGLAEEGACAEHGIDVLMIGVLGAIVIGQCTASRRRVLRQSAIYGEAHGAGRATW